MTLEISNPTEIKELSNEKHYGDKRIQTLNKISRGLKHSGKSTLYIKNYLEKINQNNNVPPVPQDAIIQIIEKLSDNQNENKRKFRKNRVVYKTKFQRDFLRNSEFNLSRFVRKTLQNMIDAKFSELKGVNIA